jgi:hypothetical protein
MDISIVGSRIGTPSCRADGLWLHSPYDPEREARRFVESALGSSRPSYVVLLGPCLDYITPALRSILPAARIVSIQYTPFFEGRTYAPPDAMWHPLIGFNLSAFLDANLDEDAISGLSVLEWEPASRAFPEEALRAKEAVRASLDRLGSSAATVKVFGKKWISNACASFLLAEKAATPRRTRMPALIVAAGPSLNSSLEAVSRFKGRFLTVAVSSAWAACRLARIEPDIVVSTDGGFWSRHHLYPLASEGAILATPLTALPGASLYRNATLLILNQGSFVESELLPSLGPCLSLPPHGTVSGSALHLASRITDGPIVALGLDLASNGDLCHARPHGFDAVFAKSTSRLVPLEEIIWNRALESAPDALSEKPWRSSRATASYASALSLDAIPLSGRLYRFAPSPQPLYGFETLHEGGLEAVLGAYDYECETLFDDAPLPSIRQRESILAERLAAWRAGAVMAAEAMGKGALPGSALVAELLRSVDIVDYAAARRAILARGDPEPSSRDLARRCDAFLTDLQRRFVA